MKKKLKPVYWLNLGVLVLSCVLIISLLFARSDSQVVWTTIWLCLAFFVVSLIASGIYYYNQLFVCQFSETGINLCWARWTYKQISYDKVKGITISGAVDRTYNPIRDENKKQKAVVSVYSSQFSFIASMQPDGISIIPSHDEDLLCRSYLCKEDILKLLEKTKSPLYVTEEQMKIHNEILSDICVSYSARVIVSCRIESNDNKFLTFVDFLNRNKSVD